MPESIARGSQGHGQERSHFFKEFNESVFVCLFASPAPDAKSLSQRAKKNIVALPIVKQENERNRIPRSNIISSFFFFSYISTRIIKENLSP